MLRPVRLGLLFTLVLSASGFSQQRLVPPGQATALKRDFVLAPGLHIREVAYGLKAAGIHEGGAKAFARLNKDTRWLFYRLEAERADLVITWNDRTKRVTELAIHYLAVPRAKSNEVVMRVKSIRFHTDGDYSVRFSRTKSRRPVGRTTTPERRSVLPPLPTKRGR